MHSVYLITYIYCISPTCFGVTVTIISENFCALYLKPDSVMKSLTMVSIVVMS